MAEQAERIGQQIGDYQLLRYLGGGNFGTVYLGEDIRASKRAAVKVLRARLTLTREIKEFLNEARMMRLHHPHIVQILDFGISDDETPYLVMDYAPNGTLRTRYPHSELVPLATVVTYTSQLASALQYAHDMQLVHRDVKPENMLLDAQNRLLLSDFGIASVAHNTRSDVTQQNFGGTIGYMAPEQFDGRPRAASDQYALAICVYEWLTGTRPFQGTVMEVAVQHRLATPKPLRDHQPSLSPAVERVVHTALAKEPRERFPSVVEFARALEQASQQQAHFPLGASASGPVAGPPQVSLPGIAPGTQTPASLPSFNESTLVSQANISNTPPHFYVQSGEQERIAEARPPVQSQGYQPPVTDPRAGYQPVSTTTGSGYTAQPHPPIKRRGISPPMLVIVGLLILVLISGTLGIIYFILPGGFSQPRTGNYATAVAQKGMMFGFDTQHNRVNPYEQTLNTDNVHNLTQKWTFTAQHAVGSSPLVVGDTVYVGSADNNVYAINRITHKSRWIFPTQGEIFSSPAFADGIVYIGSADKSLYAIDAATGKKKWSAPTGDVINSSPLVVDGVVYCSSYDGSLYALDAKTGEGKWHYTADTALYSSPAIVGDTVYDASTGGSAGTGKVFALDRTSGAVKWTQELNKDIYSSPTIADGVLYIGAGDGLLHALDAASGQPKWTFATGHEIKSSPAIHNGIVYVGSGDGSVYAINIATHTEVWSMTTGDAVNSSPLFANGVVYVGSLSHEIYAFDALNGHRLWNFLTQGSIYSSPAVVDGTLYIGSDDGHLYAFGLP